MGGYSSKHLSKGTLVGAYVPPVSSDIPLPVAPKRKKRFRITVPVHNNKRNNATRKRVNIGGEMKYVNIPAGVKPGCSFIYEEECVDTGKVYASTLPSVPGHEIVQSKPIVWGSVSHAFNHMSGESGQQQMGKEVGLLMQESQEKILEQTIEVGCNACLGMTFNVTNDSSGDSGQNKVVIVTAVGTPCIIIPTTTLPTVDATVIVEPLCNAPTNENASPICAGI